MLFVDMIAGTLIALLAGLGVGGGGLLVMYLALVKNVDQLQAQGINLIFFIICASAALIYNIKKRSLEPKKLAAIAISGAVFAALGSRVAAFVDVSLIRKCFGGLMCISGVTALIRSFLKKGGGNDCGADADTDADTDSDTFAKHDSDDTDRKGYI